ncbi:MAG: hypothetical protein MUC60_00545 [Oscillatoria sp. Prado101]|nr:hypothetical protein [Oscillatoria sp. Prado101]
MKHTPETRFRQSYRVSQYLTHTKNGQKAGNNVCWPVANWQVGAGCVSILSTDRQQPPKNRRVSPASPAPPELEGFNIF